MNISDINVTGNRPDAVRPGSVNDAARVDGGASGAAPASSGAPAADRVEISAEARAAAGAGTGADLTVARKALLGIPPLSEDRAADILKRVQEGFYSQPETLKQIASNVTADLVGKAG